MLILALFQVVALKGATVHSMVPGVEPAVTTILVEEGVIQAVGPDLEIPQDAEVHDLTGKHLIPGLVDGMIHHDMEHDPLYVMAGITFARDMGNDMSRIFLAAMPNVRNSAPGPQLLIAGAIFDGVPPATTEAVVVRNGDEVKDKLPRLIERGIQLASFHSGIPEEAWRELIATGHEYGLQVWGPIPTALSQKEALASGQDGLMYLEGFRTDAGEWDAEFAHERVLDVEHSGIAVMPLLHVYAYRSEDQGADPPIFNYLAPYYADWWRADLAQRRSLFTAEYLARGQKQNERLESVVLDLWKTGVPLLPGSAAPNPWMAPGAGLHDELEAWVRAGIPAADVLQMATSGAAQILGWGDRRGTIEVGKLADAVVYDQDPSKDIQVLRQPKGVLLRGAFMDHDYLVKWRDALRQAQEKATLEASKPLVITKPELPDGRVVLQGRVEGRAFDRVIAAEEYWVVRTFDGATSWHSRMRMPAGVGQSGTEQTLRQRFEEDRLVGFELEVDSGGMKYKVEGLRISGQFRLKRWLGDQYIDTNSTASVPHVVDAGMALPAMILEHYRKDGNCSAIYFEGMDPIISGWELQRGENGVLAAKTGKGPLVATFEKNGGLAKLARAEGHATVRYESVNCDSFGGPGMPTLVKAAKVEEASGPPK